MPTTKTFTTVLVAVRVETEDPKEAVRQAQCFVNRGTSFPVKQSKLVTNVKVIIPIEAV